jgi:hypothetical protein
MNGQSGNALGEYRFLPWLRRGIAAQLGPQTGTLPARATVQAGVNLQGIPVGGGSGAALSASVSAALYGPGDVVGIDTRHVIKTEPSDGTANFEPDYFAGIEFDEPDFPWMLTPAGANGNQLPPWLVLIVLATGEFDVVTGGSGPLPAINVHAVATLPDLSESWAWAHAQVAVDPSDQSVDVTTLLQSQPELFRSRLLCPRHLSPETAYTAFLVPAFDAGVAAGLGQPTSSSGTLNPAWTSSTQAPLQLPVYYQFSFHTSDQGDFESLVRRMQPRTLPADVGLRPMDVAHLDLGWGVGPASSSPLGMGGALRSVDTVDTLWPDPNAPTYAQDSADKTLFQTNLTRLLDATGPGTDNPASPGPDPTVVPPLYGRWLAAQPQAPPGGWVYDLNLDPRRRGAAGLGTQVVVQEQSQLMASAWKQFAGVQKANQLLRQGQLARSVLVQILGKHFQPAPTETLLAFTSGVHARVLAGTQTVRATLAQSRLPLLALSAAFRRIVRPFGPLRRRQGAGTGMSAPYSIIGRLNAGEISAAPPLTPPGGMQSIDQTSAQLYPPWAPPWLRPWLPYAPWLLLAIAVLIALLILLIGWLVGLWPPAVALAIAVILAALALAARLRSTAANATVANILQWGALTPAAFSNVPPEPGFQVVVADTAWPVWTGMPAPDSRDAAAFRSAATLVATALQAPAPNATAAAPADLATLQATLLTTLNPNATVAALLGTVVQTGPSLNWTGAGDPLAPIMAAPNFPQPMYVPLSAWSQDWLLPNVSDVPPDTLALLDADHAFIEAYMVGLNQEMGRLLLWNGYPTDQRGTYFRQFWDVSSYVPGPTDPPAGSAALQEALYDIPPVTSWPVSTPLGQNDNRPSGNLVLLVRGELLRRYPNAVIYACPAVAGSAANNEPPLVLNPNGPELYPMYRGTLAPDLTFFGFPLTANQALGQPDPNAPNQPVPYPQGVFFVFQQVPGEPRFGLEPAQPLPPIPVTQWADLSWANLGNGMGAAPPFASPGTTPCNLTQGGTLGTTPVSQTIAVEADPDGTAINPNDPANAWGVDAAQTAYITMRLPGRVAVHANTLLQPLVT